MPIFPVFLLNIGKNTSNSFLKKSIDRKKFSSSNVVSYAKTIQKSAWASLLQFAWVTMPHLPHVSQLAVTLTYLNLVVNTANWKNLQTLHRPEE